MSSASISKVHVTNLSLNDRFTAIGTHLEPQEVALRRRGRSRSRSLPPVDRQAHLTGSSLNKRFTAIATHPEPQEMAVRRRSRSRSRSMPRADRRASLANRRLLQQLAKRHKMQAALKLKRRSMRTTGGNVAMKRGTIKALRVAPNGRPIRTNSLTNIATMKADLISNGSRSSRPLRRANSSSNIAGRLGNRRPVVGGAAQRVAKRRLQRGRTNNSSARPAGGAVRRGRSRSRSRARMPETAQQTRGRSLSRGRAGNVRGRSLSRGRVENVRGRPRSRSRGRGRNDASAKAALPIKARLGVRPGTQAAAAEASRRKRGGRMRRPSISQRGVTQGRVQKRRNSVAPGGNRAIKNAVGAGGQVGRTRSRSITRNLGGRSRSRTRKGAAVGQQKSGASNQGRRGRSQQRNGGRGGAVQKKGKGVGNNGQQQPNQRRGRSRSRGGRVGRGGRKVGGNNARPQVNKESLDKELDQYMATTKTENDMDYLLKN